MKNIKAFYDGHQVVLLEPVDLPPNTLLDVVAPDDAANEQEVLEALSDQGLIHSTEPPANTLLPFNPVTIEEPPLSETVIEERR